MYKWGKVKFAINFFSRLFWAALQGKILSGAVPGCVDIFFDKDIMSSMLQKIRNDSIPFQYLTMFCILVSGNEGFVISGRLNKYLTRELSGEKIMRGQDEYE